MAVFKWSGKELTKTIIMISNRKNGLICMVYTKICQRFNPLTAGAEFYLIITTFCIAFQTC